MRGDSWLTLVTVVKIVRAGRRRSPNGATTVRSALLPRESCYPVHFNHTDMVKFDLPRNKAFQTVLTSMRDAIGE